MDKAVMCGMKVNYKAGYQIITLQKQHELYKTISANLFGIRSNENLCH